MLAEANRFYWGHNLPLAIPLYQRAEMLFTRSGDARYALYAKIGAMRTENQASFPEISAFIATQLDTPLVQHDPFLRLWCVGIKGDADQEINVAAAKQDWNQVKTLATSLGQKQWANRATGELGLMAYLQGDYKQAAALMKKALVTAALEGDDGTEVRYLELVGNGMNGLNRQTEAMFLLNRAIRIANHNGYVGTPFSQDQALRDAVGADGADLAFGRLRTNGEIQTQLSQKVSPPHKWSYWKILFWGLIGLLVLEFILGYVDTVLRVGGNFDQQFAWFGYSYLGIVAIIIWFAVRHNFGVFPRRYRIWDRSLMCTRCGYILKLQQPADLPKQSCVRELQP